jgi:hypothetical protein
MITFFENEWYDINLSYVIKIRLNIYNMKKIGIIVLITACSFIAKAQDGFSEILAAGIEVAQDYSNKYMAPAGEAYTLNLGTGWYNDARVLKPGAFSISLKGQATFAPGDRKSFLLDPIAYQATIQRNYDNTNNPPGDIAVTFGDGGTTPRLIATALGENNPSQSLIITSRDRTTGLILDQSNIMLAQGLASQGLNLVPAAFLQLGVGLGAGLEFKGRIIPKSNIGEGDIALYGGALQWELSQLFADNGKDNRFPIAISALVGYTMLDGNYDFEDGAVVEGVNQRLDTNTTSLTIAGIASTTYKVFNLYGGINYTTGNTETNLLGTYTFRSSSVLFPLATSFEDPISVQSDVSSLLGTLGASLKLGAFDLNADYTFGAFQTATVALGFNIGNGDKKSKQ